MKTLSRRAALLQALTFAAALIVLPLSGCGTAADALPPLPPVVAGTYLLGPGDQIHIALFGDQSLAGDHRVSDGGTLALPLVGNVPAAGLTPDGLAETLTAQLEKQQLMKDPKIAIEVVSYRPIFILGEVSKPGQYPYQPGMRVVTAVAVAGGFTYRAVTRQFSIVRSADGKSVEGRADREAAVRPGDVITVYERYF